MSRRILYLLTSRENASILPSLLQEEALDTQFSVSLVLLQGGVQAQDKLCSQTFVVEEDLNTYHEASRFASLSYSEVIEKVFEADQIVVL